MIFLNHVYFRTKKEAHVIELTFSSSSSTTSSRYRWVISIEEDAEDAQWEMTFYN